MDLLLGPDEFTFSSSVTSFYMDSTEVTVKDFFTYYDTTEYKYSLPSIIEDNAPMTNVTWYQSVLYCNAKSKSMGLDTAYSYDSIYYDEGRVILVDVITDYKKEALRLPTLAEGSFAAKGGAQTTYFWGEDADEYDDYAWCADNSSKIKDLYAPEIVATKLPNDYGLYDMIGNGVEMFNDYFSVDSSIYSETYSGVEDPVGVSIEDAYTTGPVDAPMRAVVSCSPTPSFEVMVLNPIQGVLLTGQLSDGLWTFRTVIKILE